MAGDNNRNAVWALLLSLLALTSDNCKLGECIRWGGEGWWVVSDSGKGEQNLMGLSYREIKIKHFYHYEYQQLSLSVLLFVLPPYNSLLFHFSLKMQERTVLFTFTWLNLKLSKVHVSNNRSNTDYDPQDILLYNKMINKIG